MTERPQQTIQLQNPVSDHFPTFIVGNADAWQKSAIRDMEGTIAPELYDEMCQAFVRCKPGMAFGSSQRFHDIVEPFAREHYMVGQDSAKGQHLVLCGAGPSLPETIEKWSKRADQLWGCNSALTWLIDAGYKPTHGITVDQTPHMCVEWHTMPDVEYLIASTVHPNLVAMLQAAGRKIRLFHNFVGIKLPPVSWPDDHGIIYTAPYEDWLYHTLYPTTIRAGSGLNTVTRAIDVAQFMGFKKITVLGADCCLRTKGKVRNDFEMGSAKHLKWLRTHTVMHADGGHALASEASPVTLTGTFDGRTWLTKADMAISAVWLVKMMHASKGQIQLVGDTFPNAIRDKSEEFLKRLPHFVDAQGRVANIPVAG